MLGFTIIVLQARWSKKKPGNELSYQSFTKNLPNYPLLEAQLTGWQARECHHQGIVPPGGKNIPDYAFQSGAGNPPRHRSSLGQRWPGYAPKIFRLYRQQYQRKTHEFGIYCPYCRQASASAEVFRGCQFLIVPQRVLCFCVNSKNAMNSENRRWNRHPDAINFFIQRHKCSLFIG